MPSGEDYAPCHEVHKPQYPVVKTTTAMHILGRPLQEYTISCNIHSEVTL